MSKKTIVGVYGSLKRGFGNYGVMEMSDGKFVGVGKTEEKFVMSGFGFPYMTRDGSSEEQRQVVIEVFEVERTNHLDSLEGHPTFYKREEMQVEMEDGSSVTAWIYVYQDHIQTDLELINSDDNYEWHE